MNKNRQSMTRRERVIATLEHREPDRVPLSMSITIDAYQNLKRYLGIELEEDFRPDRWAGVPVHPLVAEKFGLDAVLLPTGNSNISTKQSKNPDKWYDEWGVELTKKALPGGGYINEMTCCPLKSATVRDLADYKWPDPYNRSAVEGIREFYRHIHNDTDFAIFSNFGGSIFRRAQYLRGIETFLLDLKENPEFAEALLEKICKIQLARIGMLMEAAGKYVDVLCLGGEDMGNQENPVISLQMFRAMVKPHLEKLWVYTKKKLLEKNPRAKIMRYSCGAVKTFIPDLIEMQVDVLDPVQPPAEDMDLFEMKAEFGNKLIFQGGIDAQHMLPFGTVEEIHEHIKKQIRALAPGGGYICAPSYNVQGNVPPENLIAMRDAVEEFGYYPINL
ncbi:MAG: uroporphyrinogen decarboxylase [Deltaproteobacteria bacterium]|nr:uroporphyrinogen decarboxylase [Deltaproteobacteria bacterium]